MQTVLLPNTQRSTTRLGFGGSSLMGAASRKQSLALLEHAFESGIRHFDVAPMYGYGAAEDCLGEFAANHRGEITLTTKFGIPAPSNPGILRAARRTVGSALKVLPSVKKKLAAAASKATQADTKLPFTAAAASVSLEHSLRELRVERIDFFLLHEAEVADLADDGLLRFLESTLQAGKIGAYGCGSSADKIAALLTHKPAFCPVLQYDWSILDAPQPISSAFTLHHRSLTSRFAELHAALRKDAATRDRWSADTGADLAQPGTLASLMLKAALELNPASIILVSSRNHRHITDNARVASDDTLAEPARRLYATAQHEAATLLAQQ